MTQTIIPDAPEITPTEGVEHKNPIVLHFTTEHNPQFIHLRCGDSPVAEFVAERPNGEDWNYWPLPFNLSSAEANALLLHIASRLEWLAGGYDPDVDYYILNKILEWA